MMKVAFALSASVAFAAVEPDVAGCTSAVSAVPEHCVSSCKALADPSMFAQCQHYGLGLNACMYQYFPDCFAAVPVGATPNYNECLLSLRTNQPCPQYCDLYLNNFPPECSGLTLAACTLALHPECSVNGGTPISQGPEPNPSKCKAFIRPNMPCPTYCEFYAENYASMCAGSKSVLDCVFAHNPECTPASYEPNVNKCKAGISTSMPCPMYCDTYAANYASMCAGKTLLDCALTLKPECIPKSGVAPSPTAAAIPSYQTDTVACKSAIIPNMPCPMYCDTYAANFPAECGESTLADCTLKFHPECKNTNVALPASPQATCKSSVSPYHPCPYMCDLYGDSMPTECGSKSLAECTIQLNPECKLASAAAPAPQADSAQCKSMIRTNMPCPMYCDTYAANPSLCGSKSLTDCTLQFHPECKL